MVEILIEGRTGSGKTRLMNILWKALTEMGLDVKKTDEGRDVGRSRKYRQGLEPQVRIFTSCPDVDLTARVWRGHADAIGQEVNDLVAVELPKLVAKMAKEAAAEGAEALNNICCAAKALAGDTQVSNKVSANLERHIKTLQRQNEGLMKKVAEQRAQIIGWQAAAQLQVTMSVEAELAAATVRRELAHAQEQLKQKTSRTCTTAELQEGENVFARVKLEADVEKLRASERSVWMSAAMARITMVSFGVSVAVGLIMHAFMK